jgi:hypothetical protein
MTFLFIFIKPTFNTNDDFAMMFIANGYYYGNPSEHLIFTNIIIGLILKFLYTVIPTISWYPIYLYFFHLISCSLLFTTILSVKKNIIHFSILAYTLLIFEIYMLMNLQFTSTSLTLGFSSILYYLVFARQKKASKWVPVIAGVLLGTAGIIRTNSFFGALIFGFPLLLYGVKHISRNRTSLFVLSALCVFLGSSVTNNLYYHSAPAWQDYFEFNKVRGSLHGTPKIFVDEEDKSNFLKKINWSENDYAMFSSWFYTDRSRFSTNALKIFAKQSKSALSFKDNLDATIASFMTFNKSFQGKIIYGVTLLSILLTLTSKTKKYFLLGYIIWNFIIILYLINYVRFPPRVGVPLFFCLSLSLLLFGEIPFFAFLTKKLFQKNLVKTITKMITIVFLVWVLIFAPVQETLTYSRKNAINHQQFISILETLKKVNSEGIFVVWGASLKYEYCSPFTTIAQLPKLKLIGLGWRVNSPPHREWLKKLKIDDLYQAIATRNDIYLITTENLMALYEQYMLEHYGKVVKLKSLLTIDDFDDNIDESDKIKVFI